MTKYVLAQKYTLHKKLGADRQLLDNGEAWEYFLCKNGVTNFVVNKSIYTFLSFFSSPQYINSAINTYGGIESLAKEQVKSFVQQMVQRGVLIESKPKQKTLQGKSNDLRFKIGDCFKDLIILKLIAKRDETELYLAEIESTREKFVIKTLRKCFSESVTNQSAFDKEFSIMRTLPFHQNVRKLIGYFPEHQVAVLEHIDGVSIRKWLKKDKRFSQKMRLIQQIIQAIAHLHKHKIVHGDIHTSNFLVNTNHNAHLIDFGYALREQDFGQENISKGGIYGYLAPEKINKSSFDFLRYAPDFRSEVYQLGILIYRIIYEQLPFTAFTWKKLYHQIQNDSRKFPRKTPHKEIVPKEYIALLEKCLCKNPVQRFENVTELYFSFPT